MRGTFADKEKKKEKKKAKTVEQTATTVNKKPGQGTPNSANTQGNAALILRSLITLQTVLYSLIIYQKRLIR